ncbi:TMPSC protease, partial [Turnix velox]|nr:TMPSC protease [Turnix velox]
IVGGQDTVAGAWPWAVSLQLRRPETTFTHVCGAGLIRRKWVLTAGHCVTGRADPKSWRAVLGVYNLHKHDRSMVKRRIRSIRVHPRFKRETFENDLALFELRYPVRFSGYIQPICLPPSDLPLLMENGTECFIGGWGRTGEQGDTSDVLKEAKVEIIPYSHCNSSGSYGGLLNENMLCAGSRLGGIDACQGDSGGPLACHLPSTSKYHLIGVSSFGLGCGRATYPGIYARVSRYRRWL